MGRGAVKVNNNQKASIDFSRSFPCNCCVSAVAANPTQLPAAIGTHSGFYSVLFTEMRLVNASKMSRPTKAKWPMLLFQMSVY